MRPCIRDFRAKCLNLGCGNSIKPSDLEYNWYNLDMERHPGVDVVHNLEDRPLPFPDEFFDYIHASHVLEHVRSYPELMRELHRILKPRGCLHIKVPEARCRAAYADPTHIHSFVPETWLHWDKKSNLGYETMKTSEVGFSLEWNEVIQHHRPVIDDGVPGNYFTELLVDLEKAGEHYPWEPEAQRLVKEMEEKAKCQNQSS